MGASNIEQILRQAPCNINVDSFIVEPASDAHPQHEIHFLNAQHKDKEIYAPDTEAKSITKIDGETLLNTIKDHRNRITYELERHYRTLEHNNPAL